MTLKTIAQKAQENPGLTESKIRWMIQNSRENGMNESGVIARIGGRIYIDDGAWDRWVEANKKMDRSTSPIIPTFKEVDAR